MNKAQEAKVRTFGHMGYRPVEYSELLSEAGAVLVARDMPKGKVLFQEINTAGVTIRSFSRPTTTKQGE